MYARAAALWNGSLVLGTSLFLENSTAWGAAHVAAVGAITLALGRAEPPLRLVSDAGLRAAVFSLLGWAGAAAREAGSWVGTGSPDDERGRVGAGWPWG